LPQPPRGLRPCWLAARGARRAGLLVLAIIESRSITSDKVYSRKQIGETGKRKPRAGSIVLQTEQGRGSVIAGLLRVALSFRSRRKTGRLRLYIATAESDPKQPLRRLARVMKPPGAAFPTSFALLRHTYRREGSWSAWEASIGRRRGPHHQSSVWVDHHRGVGFHATRGWS
jgi:hypothetical protein